jgi:peptidyl-prolyl cis-trans isomerase B (cyclophilin B)
MRRAVMADFTANPDLTTRAMDDPLRRRTAAVPSNEQRRDAAKRKLERQLEERAKRDRKRRQLTIAGSVVGVIVVVAAIVTVFVVKSDDKPGAAAPASTDAPPTSSPNKPGELPRVKPAAASVDCAYTPVPGYTGKAWKLPHTQGVRTIENGVPIKISVSVATSQGNIGLMLDPSESPCAANSFASLIGQGFFDGTKCQQLTNTAPNGPNSIHALECGDPTDTGSGGPGYSFAPEYPRNRYTDDDAGLQMPVDYKRGVLAMFNSADAGPSGIPQGSQFFMVFGDSQLPPSYTIFGTVDATGLQTLDRVGAAGTLPPDAKTHMTAPKLPVAITSMRLDIG